MYLGASQVFLKNGPFPASFPLSSSLQYTVDSKQMFYINKFLPMTGFKLRTSGIGSNRSTNWATTTALGTSQVFRLVQKGFSLRLAIYSSVIFNLEWIRPSFFNYRWKAPNLGLLEAPRGLFTASAALTEN